MQQTNKINPIGFLFIPIFIHLGISFLVTMIAEAIVMGSMAPELLNTKIEPVDKIIKMTNELMKYTTEITSVTAALSIPIFAFMLRRDRKCWAAAGVAAREKTKLKNYLWIVVLSIAACIGLNNILTLSNLAFYSDRYAETSQALYAASFPMQLLGIGLVSPIMEELLFRGLIYNRMLRIMTQRRAMILSCLVFGIYHGNIVQGIYGGVLAYALVYLYEKYGSLKAPIFAHVVLNTTALVITEYGGFAWMFKQPIRVGIITVICAGISAAVFVVLQNWKTDTADMQAISKQQE